MCNGISRKYNEKCNNIICPEAINYTKYAIGWNLDFKSGYLCNSCYIICKYCKQVTYKEYSLYRCQNCRSVICGHKYINCITCYRIYCTKCDILISCHFCNNNICKKCMITCNKCYKNICNNIRCLIQHRIKINKYNRLSDIKIMNI